jgi:subtilisin family serine protease
MRYIHVILILCLTAGLLPAMPAFGPQLQEKMLGVQNDESIEIMIVMNEQSNEEYLAQITKDLPRREKRYAVIEELKKLSSRTQSQVLSFLDTERKNGNASEITSFWIINAVCCKAKPSVIEALSGIEGIAYLETSDIISKNVLLTVGEPVPVDELSRTVEWNVIKVAADSCWQLGYKGQGVIVGLIDTGCNYNHLDLRDHMWIDANYPYYGWNFELGNNNPIDVAGHGTHCSGTIGSDGSAGDSCGMSPQCSLMVCRVRTNIAYPMPDTISEKNVLDAMQFVIAPPLSPTHGADVVSMSLGWYMAWTPRRSVWRKGVTNVALAGIPYFIAAGNERGSSYCPLPYNLRCPGDAPGPWHHPSEAKGRLGGAISIAATDNTDALASFSSTGPSCWEDAPWYWDYPWRPGPGLLKPDIAAPGVNIVSCLYSNNSGYTTMSGTSMATPCCAGVAALLLSKNPNLTVAQIDSIMQFTALDLGTAGKDTLFGAGRIRARLAIDNTPAGSAIDLRLGDYGTAVLDPAPTGNGNAYFDPSETITLVDTLVNLGSAPATGVTGILRTTNADITIVDSMSSYGDISTDARGNNSADPFVLRADTLINIGTLVPFDLVVSSGAYTRTLNFQLRMGSVCGPDSAGYFMIDDADSFYTEAPVYNWIEINPSYGGPGTTIGAGGVMTTLRVRSPFTVRHYTKRISSADSISVCSNGWIAIGRSTLTIQHNSGLPKRVDYGNQTSVPNMIAAYWDTLSTASPASWWYYNDAMNHRFVIQCDSLSGPAGYPFFQYVIYDTTAAGPGGQNDIIIQYKKAANPYSCTVGHQDSTKAYGWTYLFNTMYDNGASPLANGRAVKITTKQPRMKQWIVSIDEFKSLPDMGSRLVVLRPVPFRGSVSIFYNITAAGRSSLKIYNTAGQLVKTLFAGYADRGVSTRRWNGLDDQGRAVSSGIYFFTLETGSKEFTVRGILLK